jgi:capsular polysaccharide biosynthesis protein
MAEDPRNVPEPGAPYGRIPFPMGDRLALKIIQTVPDPAARRAAYDATDLDTVVNLARSHELAVRNCFAREQGCDVRVAAYVMSQFRTRRLFWTHAHPTGELMFFVLAQLFGIAALRSVFGLPYDQLVEGARHWAAESNVFVGEEAPIHPAVAKHFGLTWWRPDQQYVWLGEGRTFDQWIDWYLTYLPGSMAPPQAAQPPAAGRAVPVGPWLDALIRDKRAGPSAVLVPPRTIDRVPFLVRSPIDTSLAPFGKYFDAPDYRRYRTVDAVVACLPGGTVIGREGVVLFQGKVLHDTMRNVTANEGAPAVRAVSAAGILLQGGLTTRHLAGTYMLGHSGAWRNYAHWLIEALPRLVAFMQARGHFPDLKLLLPPLPPGSFQAQTLELLGIDPAWVEAEAQDEALTCELLLSTSAFDLWSVSPYCRLAADRLAAAAEAAASAPGLGPIVYIHRGSAQRQVRNFEALAAALQARGAQIADFEAMPLTQQIAAMRQASVVVGENGVALANILFCRPGTTVIELFNPASVQPAYWSMASCCGLGYGFLVGRHVPTDRYPAPDQNGDYDVPIEALLQTLDALASRPAAAVGT